VIQSNLAVEEAKSRLSGEELSLGELGEEVEFGLGGIAEETHWFSEMIDRTSEHR
jgi:hypothetical protein